MLEKVAGKVEILKSRMSLDGSSGEGGKEGMRREWSCQSSIQFHSITYPSHNNTNNTGKKLNNKIIQ